MYIKRAYDGTGLYPVANRALCVQVAAGIGITPMRSMVHEPVGFSGFTPRALLYSVRTAADATFLQVRVPH
jgi:ferredoxin-NADP reductase